MHQSNDTMATPKTVYYLPGKGRKLHEGLGQALLSRGWDVTGRATVEEFQALRFDEQVDTVVGDLTAHFWSANSYVVANSFGAYLFLHAQAEMGAFPGKVLLLSPIVGTFESEATQQVFVPPRSDLLRELAQAKRFPVPSDCDIHVGADDWQSVPSNVLAFGQLTGIPVTVAPGRGHTLGSDYVGPLLDQWLP